MILMRQLVKVKLTPVAEFHGTALKELEGVDPLAFVVGRAERPLALHLHGRGAEIDVATTPGLVANAWKVRLSVGVILPEEGTKGSPGYQPPSTIQLVSDVALRNAGQITF